MNEALKERIELAGSKTYLDILDVSLLTNLSISTIRRRVGEKQIKSYQNTPKGKLIFRRADIEKWIENGQR